MVTPSVFIKKPAGGACRPRAFCFRVLMDWTAPDIREVAVQPAKTLRARFLQMLRPCGTGHWKNHAPRVTSVLVALAAEGCRNRVELIVGVGSDRLNGGQANHDDESQHNGVLHRGRTIFGNQETADAVHEIFHRVTSSCRTTI